MKSQAEIEVALKLAESQQHLSPTVVSVVHTLEWVLDLDTIGASLLERAIHNDTVTAERSFAE